VENLQGSGSIAGETSRAYQDEPWMIWGLHRKTMENIGKSYRRVEKCLFF
jgi:hypothetical protein